jgi:hypothetical protein
MPKAIANIVSVSPYHNLSAGDLADQLGAVKAEIAVLEAREKALRDELIRRGVSECQGAAFGASITEDIRWTLNTSRQIGNGAGLVRRPVPAAVGHDGFGETARRRCCPARCSVREGGA